MNNNEIDGDWPISSNDTSSSADSDTAGSLRDFVVDDSNCDRSSLDEENLSEIERKHGRHAPKSSPADKKVRCDRAINCTRELLEIIESMNPEEVKIEVSIHITGTTEQDVQYPSSSIRIHHYDSLICGVDQLRIAVPHQCKHSTISAEPILGMDKTSNPASGLSKSAIY